MKTTPIIWLLIILIVLFGTATWFVQHRSPKGAGGIGDVLLKELLLAEIASISIKSANNQVALAKKAGQWVVENRFDYRADFTTISSFVEKLTAARIGREFPIREDIRKRLKLNPPANEDADDSEKGTRILIKNKTGDLLADILFGAARRLDGTGIPDSHYLVLGGYQRVYLVDAPFTTLSKIPQGWMAMPIIEAPAEDVRKIECFQPGADSPTYVFARTAKGKALLPAKQPGKMPLNETVVKKLEWAITYLPLEDVLPPSVNTATIGLGESIRLNYFLFNGMIYRIFPCASCSDRKSCYVKIEVDYENPDTSPKSLTESLVGLHDDNFLAAKGLNAKLGNWVYKISGGHHSSLITDIDQLKK
jgi:Domain of unknown function (DUF4340)